MAYQHYLFEDFINDDYFIHWVKTSDSVAESYWQDFLVQYPAKREVLEQAQTTLLYLLSQENVGNHDELESEIWQEVVTETGLETPVRLLKPVVMQHWIWWAAASVALLAGVWGGSQWFQKNQQLPSASLYEKMTTETPQALAETINKTDQPMLLTLPDGSKVRLSPNSRISYGTFSVRIREVFLTGEAFFDVVKNPNQPFLVYANEVVTKVLGTSFNVRAYETDKDIIVSVKTGKVSVYQQVNQQKKPVRNDPEIDGVVLTPNQQAVFHREAEQLVKALQPRPVLLVAPQLLPQTAFEDAPVEKVLLALEKAYGIDMVFDEETLKDCTITTTLTNETLFEKLQIICKAIGAEYKVIGDQVVINSRGCH